MSSGKRGQLEEVRRYLERSVRLLSQGEAYLVRGDAEKASEALWGSVVTALSAFAALREIRLTSHADLRAFARQLAAELRDERVHRAFTDAETLHANFYHSFLDAEGVRIRAEAVGFLVRRIGELVEREVRRWSPF